VDVSAQFAVESQLLRNKLENFTFDAVYTSPLQRCQKLAHALCRKEADFGAYSHSIQVDDRLKELNFGDWELSQWNEIPREIFDGWASDYTHQAPPNGETFSQLHARATSFLSEVSSHLHGKHVLVITHGGLIRAILAEVLNMPLKGLFRIAIDHASVTQVSFDNDVPKINFVNR
jgi:alpha-ribazole phosphatase